MNNDGTCDGMLILALPDEILLIIFDHVLPYNNYVRGIVNIFLTCRLFHDVASSAHIYRMICSARHSVEEMPAPYRGRLLSCLSKFSHVISTRDIYRSVTETRIRSLVRDVSVANVRIYLGDNKLLDEIPYNFDIAIETPTHRSRGVPPHVIYVGPARVVNSNVELSICSSIDPHRHAIRNGKNIRSVVVNVATKYITGCFTSSAIDMVINICQLYFIL